MCDSGCLNLGCLWTRVWAFLLLWRNARMWLYTCPGSFSGDCIFLHPVLSSTVDVPSFRLCLGGYEHVLACAGLASC